MFDPKVFISPKLDMIEDIFFLGFVIQLQFLQIFKFQVSQSK